MINGWSNRTDISVRRLSSVILFITSWTERFVGEGWIDEAKRIDSAEFNSLFEIIDGTLGEGIFPIDRFYFLFKNDI